MDKLLKQNEVLDDLQLNNRMIIQSKSNYRFSSDSVLLANFAKTGHKDKVVEFCSGSGVISILLNEKCKPQSIVGFELQESLCDMSTRSLKYNKIENIKFICAPLAEATKYVEPYKIDVVVCNPPYYKEIKNANINEKYKLAKYEISTNIAEIFETANKLLKYTGKFYLVHIPDRIEVVMSEARKNNFECKKLQFVYSGQNKDSHLVLFCFSKGGKEGCQVLKPLYL